jgi:hypothetical protein
MKDLPMLGSILVSLGALYTTFSPLHSIVIPASIQPSHSMIGPIQATQAIIQNNTFPPDVAHLILHISWQERAAEQAEWHSRLNKLNSSLKKIRCNSSPITIYDVMSLGKKEKTNLQDICEAADWHTDSYWDEPKIMALPLYLKNKFGKIQD